MGRPSFAGGVVFKKGFLMTISTNSGPPSGHDMGAPGPSAVAPLAFALGTLADPLVDAPSALAGASPLASALWSLEDPSVAVSGALVGASTLASALWSLADLLVAASGALVAASPSLVASCSLVAVLAEDLVALTTGVAITTT